MKTSAICGMTVLIILACSCSLGPPTVDATGIWLGDYTGSSAADSGKLVLKLFQADKGIVRGTICFRQEPIGSYDVGVSVYGIVHGAKGRLTISNNSRKYLDFTIEGTTIGGTMNIDGAKGTWTSEYLPTKILRAQKKFDPPFAETWKAKFAFDGTRYWFTNGNSDRGFITDQAGALVDSFTFSNAGYGIGALLWDGSDMLCARNRGVDITDTSGNQTPYITNGCPTAINGLAKIANNYWMTVPANISGSSQAVQQIDQSGNPGSTPQAFIPLPIPPNGLAFDGTDLYVLGSGGDLYDNIILKVDIAAGKVIGGYLIEPESDFQFGLSDICFSGAILMGLRGNQPEVLELQGL
jgi:hypothetical protein